MLPVAHLKFVVKHGLRFVLIIAMFVLFQDSVTHGSGARHQYPDKSPRQSTATSNNATDKITEILADDAVLTSIIKERQQYYSEIFPDIQFVTLYGGDSWDSEMEVLDILLGHEPVSLDYEHKEDSREDLMYVSIERVRLMLINDIPSASFKEMKLFSIMGCA